MAAAEAQSARCMALVDAAQPHAACRSSHDDEALSLGAGAGSRSLAARRAARRWRAVGSGLHDIPTALVTGSNGKTTTVRLLAAMLRAHGLRAGYSCTDGVFVDGELRRQRRLLRPGRRAHACCATRACRRRCWKPRAAACCAAAWRCAHADVAVVTNISPDHFGEYGIARPGRPRRGQARGRAGDRQRRRAGAQRRRRRAGRASGRARRAAGLVRARRCAPAAARATRERRLHLWRARWRLAPALATAKRTTSARSPRCR